MSTPLPVADTQTAGHDAAYDTHLVRWGILGAGGIAHKMAEAIGQAEGNELVAVAARDAARAREFAAQYGARSSYGSYADLGADDQVDVVYIATTHPHHRDQALAMIEAGKAVLVEKPLSLNAAQATEVLDAAKAKGVFAMEAMWMRLQPLMRRLSEIVAAGEIGDVVKVSADLPVPFPYDANHRLFDLDNGGGALLDLGVYPATFAWLFLGRPDTVHVMGSLAETGADHVAAMQWGYENGAIAHVYTTSQGCGPIQATVMGRNGWISIPPKFHSYPSRALVHRGDHLDFTEEEIDLPSRGYVHQVEEVARCLRAGLLESPLVTHEDTIGILEVLDAARIELGVHYPQESDPLSR